MVYIFGLLSCGALARHIGWYKVWFLVSGLLMTAGGAAMYAILYGPKLPSTSYIYGISVVLAVSFNTSLTPFALAPQMVKKASQVPFAIQLLGFNQNLGQLVGLMAASAIFQTRAFDGLSTALAGQGLSDDKIRAAMAGANSAVLESVSPELRERCLEAIVHSIADCWLVVVVSGGMYLIASLFMTGKRFPS